MVTALRERPVQEVPLTFKLRGGLLTIAQALSKDSDAVEILAEGPAGTGKTRTILELINLLAHRYPRSRYLIVRKHQVTLTSTCLVTFNEKVRHVLDGVTFFGGNKDEPAAYRYPNGSRIVVGGMDNATKVLSSEYDLIYVNEATELSEGDWETLTTRLRNGVLPHQRIVGDCNPAHDKHWLNRRCNEGKVLRIRSRLQDNPVYFTDTGAETEAGAAYLNALAGLTGPRRERLLLGKWTGHEHAIYKTFARETHVRPLPAGIQWQQGAIGGDQGGIHRAAGVAIKVDQYGRRWAVEAWAQPDTEHGDLTAREIGRLAVSHGIYRVRTDPTAAAVAAATSRLMGSSVLVNAAQGTPGARIARIRMATRLFAVFPSGRVPSRLDEYYQRNSIGALTEDSPGLLFVDGAPGIEDLVSQIEGYHYVPQETDLLYEDKVARIDDDLVAAMEYAIEELEDEPIDSIVAGTMEQREASADRHEVSQYRLRDTLPPPAPPSMGREGSSYGLPGRGRA